MIFCSLFPINAFTQNVISVKSPLPDSTVRNGEIWIVCVVDPRLKILPGSVQMLIEGAEVSPLINVNGNTITILILNKIRPDKYNVELRLRSESGKMYRKRWAFYVGDFQITEDSVVQVRPVRQKQEFKPHFKGNIYAAMKFTHLNGNGSYLRQEPPQMHDFRINATLHLNTVTIPLKLYLTNQENSMVQRRNRFMTGIQSEKTGVRIGDINLNYHKIALNGTSVKGVLFDFKIRSTEYNLFHGYVNRAIEGEKLKYQEGTGFPPGNMMPDSSFLREGTYRRKLSAMNITFKAIDGTKFNIMFLKSTDDSLSIRYGGQVSQNFVFGAGNQLKTRNNRFYADMQVALSLTTFDIRRGVYSKQKIDDIFGSDIPFYPEKYKWLIIFNGTTTPMTWKNRTPLAFFGDFKLNMLRQTFNFSYHRTGSSFYSFGNPYLVNDRRFMSIEDRFSALNKRLSGRISYSFITNNLSKNYFTKKNTGITQVSLNYKISKSLPSFVLGGRIYDRQEKIVKTDSLFSRTYLYNLMAGLNWNLKKKSFTHNIQVNYNQFVRTTADSRSNSYSINFNVNEQYKNKILFSAFYNSFVMTNDSADLGIISTYGVRMNLLFFDEKLKAGGGFHLVKNEESGLMEASERLSYEAEISYLLLKNLTLSITAGYGHYQEETIPAENYQEKWIFARLNYSID